MKYYIGEYEKDANLNGRNGWIVGNFMEDSTPQKTEQVEVKFWSFDVGQTDHKTKISKTCEVCFVFSGETEGIIDNKKIKLKGGQYVVIPPGIKNNLVQNITSPAKGLAVKAPSDVNAKILV